MKIHKLKDMFRGWFIGDFEPSALKTDKFEVGILTHKKGEYWPKHFHKEAIEINLLLDGHMIIRERELKSGDIFTIDPYEIADSVFLEDCTVIVIKTPSVPGDKYEVS